MTALKVITFNMKLGKGATALSRLPKGLVSRYSRSKLSDLPLGMGTIMAKLLGLYKSDYLFYVIDGLLTGLQIKWSRRNVLRESGELLKDYDICCLQEVDGRYLDVLLKPMRQKDNFLANYVHSGKLLSAHFGIATIWNSNPISKVSVVNHKLTKVQVRKSEVNIRTKINPGKAMIYAKFRVGKIVVSVINIHLSLFKRERKAQIREVASVVKKIMKSEKHIVLMGDFNTSTLEDPILKSFYKLGLKPVVQEASFPSWRSAENLDQIWVSESVKVTNSGVVSSAANLSDHLPVFANLEFEDV